MELLQLKYFCDAAESENFSTTAKKFGVPPSDISQSIKRLERELGTPLFTRCANSIALNDVGRAFFNKISKALAIIYDASSAAVGDEKQGQIRICINTNRRIVMQALEKYRFKYPDVEIITTHLHDPISEEYDLIIDSDDERLSGFDKQLLISEEIVLAMRNDNPNAKRKSLSVAALVDEPFITMGSSSSMSRLTYAICRDFGFKPRIAMQSDDPFYVRKCVELGLGITFVPSYSWSGQFADNVVFKSLNGYKRDTYVYTNPKRHLPLCARRFFEMLIIESRIEK